MTRPAQAAAGHSAAPRNGREFMELFVPQSPFVGKLGVHTERLADDNVRLRLPWDPQNVTVGEMVHGGAIAALVDITVMVAAWCGAALPKSPRGVTTSVAIEFLRPARRTDLIGEGRVLRRGRSLVNCEVDVLDPQGEKLAKALATYKLG
jgi:uncharacterized protein (TIGR00369 family)